MEDKQLHGHAVIELRDAKTGKVVDRQEHDNIVTNGTMNFMRNMAVLSSGSNKTGISPMWENLFCGVLLFGSSINATADNYGWPSARLIGHAGDTVSDGYLNTRGDFNFAESGLTSNGVKYVWDFGTDDANGTIASVCLTNATVGFNGENDRPTAFGESHSRTGSTPSNYRGNSRNNYIGVANNTTDLRDACGKNVVDISEDSDGVILTTLYKTSETNIRLEKHKFYIKRLDLIHSLFDSLNALFSTENITIEEENQTRTGSNVVYLNGDDGYYYIVTMETQNISGTQYINTKIAKINATTHAYTAAVVGNVERVNNLAPIYDANALSSGRNAMCVRDGYLYCPFYETVDSVTRYFIGKISLNDPSQFYEVYGSDFNTVGSTAHGAQYYLFTRANGDIHFNRFIIDSSDNIYPKDAYHGTSETVANFKVIESKNFSVYEYNNSSSSSSSYATPLLVINHRYLATINNLASPVTKTDQLTMKITYTLTYS